MIYYRYKDAVLISKQPLGENFVQISESSAKEHEGHIFAAYSKDPKYFRRSFAVTDASMLFKEAEDLSLLSIDNMESLIAVPEWVRKRIIDQKLTFVNLSFPSWRDVIDFKTPNTRSRKKWKVNVVGLGDVGGTLVTGLRLMGSDVISSIGIYDMDENRMKRWEFEGGQIFDPSLSQFPDIRILGKEELFDCDMFVFCVSVGVPDVGREVKDVRLVQFEGNSKIVSIYARLARKAGFKGIFAVVSDPVDLLCKVAFNESNKDESGTLDFMGLASDQIRGYGLGVMNARAAYYAKRHTEVHHYLNEGRAFGPHGNGLIIADSIENYDIELSDFLTERTKNANLDVRSTGFKPYIAPALSSGSLSLLATIRGEWHYSATFLGGTFFGSRNRLTAAGIELERLKLPQELYNKLIDTYKYLKELYD